MWSHVIAENDEFIEEIQKGMCYAYDLFWYIRHLFTKNQTNCFDVNWVTDTLPFIYYMNKAITPIYVDGAYSVYATGNVFNQAFGISHCIHYLQKDWKSEK